MKPYGRQARDKTIRSISLSSRVYEAAMKDAQARGMNFSEYVSWLLSEHFDEVALRVAQEAESYLAQKKG